MPPSVSLLIPAYNEAASIAGIAERSLKILQRLGAPYELIILDDCSTDGTSDVLQALQQRYPEHVRVVRHTENLGIAATFEELYRLASLDFVFLVSADGEYPPEALLQCLPLLDHCDIVICKRKQKQYTPYRHMVSGSYRWLPRLLFGVDLYDSGSIKCVRREILRNIPVRSKSVFVEAERIIRAVKRGYTLGMVHIDHGIRMDGKARGARIATVTRAALDLCRCFWDIQIMGRI
jgi:glycosyltransferase involved in cell wall biosynthesis